MRILQALVLIIGLAVFANAQEKEKFFTLSGIVHDYSEEKAVVPLTEIVAENKDGRSFKTTSDKKGIYKLSIPFGEYTLIFHKEGFKITKVLYFENLSLPEKTFEAYLDVGSCSNCGVLNPEPENNEEKRKPITFDLSKTQKAVEIYLSGTVTDQFGAIIPKVKIKVKGKKKKLIAETDENGLYKINLPEGIYTIEFKASGHKSYKIKKYRKRSYQPVILDVVLYANPTPII